MSAAAAFACSIGSPVMLPERSITIVTSFAATAVSVVGGAASDSANQPSCFAARLDVDDRAASRARRRPTRASSSPVARAPSERTRTPPPIFSTWSRCVDDVTFFTVPCDRDHDLGVAARDRRAVVHGLAAALEPLRPLQLDALLLVRARSGTP